MSEHVISLSSLQVISKRWRNEPTSSRSSLARSFTTRRRIFWVWRRRWRSSVLSQDECLDGVDDGLRPLVIGVEELDNAHLLRWILLQVRKKALCATTVHTIAWRDKPPIPIVVGWECLCIGCEYPGQGL